MYFGLLGRSVRPGSVATSLLTCRRHKDRGWPKRSTTQTRRLTTAANTSSQWNRWFSRSTSIRRCVTVNRAPKPTRNKTSIVWRLKTTTSFSFDDTQTGITQISRWKKNGRGLNNYFYFTRSRIPERTFESLRNSCEREICTQLLCRLSPASAPFVGKNMRSSTLRQRLTRSLVSLAPSQWTCNVFWCPAEGYRNGRSALNPMDSDEPYKGCCCCCCCIQRDLLRWGSWWIKNVVAIGLAYSKFVPGEIWRMFVTTIRQDDDTVLEYFQCPLCAHV